MPKKRPGNQHNHRHENGIVAPGKRITKQKSNGNINGSALGPVAPAAGSDPSPSVGLATAHVSEQPSHRQFTGARAASNEPQISQTKLKDGSTSDVETLPRANSQSQEARPVATSKQTKSLKSDDDAANLPPTILRSYPLADTLTILIILLSVPSTLLTLLNTIFAMLTFMPSSASFWTILSLPHSWNDFFTGNGGNPSLATIIITDILGVLIWMLAWTPFQSLAIEYTQAVVAANLGGNNTGKKHGYDSTFLCMAIVTARHLFSREWLPARVLGFDWRAVLSQIPYTNEQRQFFNFSYDNYLFTAEKKGVWGWYRVLLALHILIQGLVHVARRYLQRREYFQPTSTASKHDPEAGPNGNARPGPSPLLDSAVSSSTTPSPTPTSKNSLPVMKDTRDKISAGKKRRKQVAHIRSQQPLWAAFAATRVTLMRGHEHSYSDVDIKASDTLNADDLGDFNFQDLQDISWVTEVRADSFTLESTHIASSETPDPSCTGDPDDLTHPFPFTVRLNDATWPAFNLERIEETAEAPARWRAVISGLVPSSTYKCSLVSSKGDAVFHTSTVTTSPSLPEEKEASGTSSDARHRAPAAHAPTSPTTTLRQAVLQSEAGLNESIARQKRNKKENKNLSATTKKEIDGLNAKIAKLSSEDRSHASRHMQWNQNIKQADEAVAAMNDELESLQTLPDDEIADHQERKKQWEAAQQDYQSLQDEFNSAKDAAHREITAAQHELNSARQKKERLQARNAKLSDQVEKAAQADLHEHRNKDQKRSKPAEEEGRRAHIEQDFQRKMSALQQECQLRQYNISQIYAQIQQIENEFQEQQVAFPAVEGPEERPLTPEGDLPGENPQNAAAAAPQPPVFGTPESGGLRSHSGSLRREDHRLRSSSLQSNTSNHVDFDNHGVAPPMPSRAIEAIREARKRSAGSTGGSSGSNSQRDPQSPVASSRMQESPFLKKSPVWNP